MDFTEAMNSGRKEKDVCEYHVYLKHPDAARIREIVSTVERIARPWTDGYIWQDQSFRLDVQPDHSLSGSTRFGDCIEDEWFIVWILNELSRQCPDTFIQITDTDGAFLLIESAMNLPRWLDPDTASHRSWLNSGRLVIIEPSPTHIATRQCPDLSLDEALDHLRAGKATLHNQAIQDDAFTRIRGYPEQSRREIHRVECLLPRAVATALHSRPQLISPVCIEFYTRDPLQTSSYNERSRFLSLPQVNDIVSVSVRFTRTLYAQIKGSRYTSPSWYPMPPHSSASYDAAVTGSKLTCGMTLLSTTDQSIVVPESLPTETEISAWDHTVDPDDYLDVNFEEMEKAMAGTSTTEGDVGAGGTTVKKMIAQLSKFMGGESTFEGAGFSDDEPDEDDEDDSDSESDGFGDMMQFLKSPIATRQSVDLLNQAHVQSTKRDREIDKEEESEEDSVGDLAEYMSQLDEELATHGVSTTRTDPSNEEEEKVDDEDEDFKIDYALAKNMLESMKGGQSGPAAALLGRLGISVPVHHEEELEQEPLD